MGVEVLMDMAEVLGEMGGVLTETEELLRLSKH